MRLETFTLRKLSFTVVTSGGSGLYEACVPPFLFIGPDHGSAIGGREQLSRLHRRVLAELLGKNFNSMALLGGSPAVSAMLSGRIDGTDAAAEARVLAFIAERDITKVWLDGSNLGVLAKSIKRRFPAIEIFSFFHNVEPRFFLGALRQKPRLRAAGVLAATFAAERKAVRYSDRLVVLNARDAKGVERWHKRRPRDILPMAIEDGWSTASEKNESDSAPLLFVGGSFYANKAGIGWFAEHVAPRIKVETLVIGSGMEDERATLEQHEGVKVVGRVDSLAPYYARALAVIAPIFHGSGMKTKVAEAWMHGKHVIGTPEAFTGYDQEGIDAACTSADEFAAAVCKAVNTPPPRFDRLLRSRYDQNHSPAALRTKLIAMLGAEEPS